MTACSIQIVQHLQPGGIETMALDLANRFGPNAHIIALEGNREECLARWPMLEQLSSKLHFLEKRPGLDMKALLRLSKLMRKLKPRAVHTHHIGPMLYGGIAARMAGVRTLIHTEHDAWYLESQRTAKLHQLIRFMTRPVMVADCETVAKSLNARSPVDGLVVVRNGVDTEKFCPGDKHVARTELGLPQDAVLIGCAARLEAVKGHDLLLDAMSHLPGNYHLVLAGDGSLREELEEKALSLGLSNCVHFLGSHQDMPSFYRALDVFCLSSHAEGLPLSPLEAQACGVPAVLTHVGGCAEAVCHQTGKLLSDREPQQLALKLLLAAEDRGLVSPRDFICAHADQTLTTELYRSLMHPEEYVS